MVIIQSRPEGTIQFGHMYTSWNPPVLSDVHTLLTGNKTVHTVHSHWRKSRRSGAEERAQGLWKTRPPGPASHVICCLCDRGQCTARTVTPCSKDVVHLPVLTAMGALMLIHCFIIHTLQHESSLEKSELWIWLFHKAEDSPSGLVLLPIPWRTCSAGQSNP